MVEYTTNVESMKIFKSGSVVRFSCFLHANNMRAQSLCKVRWAYNLHINHMNVQASTSQNEQIHRKNGV